MNHDDIILVRTDGYTSDIVGLYSVFDNHGSLVDNEKGFCGYHSKNVTWL